MWHPRMPLLSKQSEIISVMACFLNSAPLSYWHRNQATSAPGTLETLPEAKALRR